MLNRIFAYGNRTGWLVLAVLVLLILLPLAAVIVQVLLPGVFFGNWELGDLSLLLDVFKRPLWYQSLKNTLLLGLGTTLFATIIGGALATVRAQWRFPGARLLDLTVWLLIITPSFILAQGWVMFASANGLARQWFGWDWMHSVVFTPGGLIAVMSLSKFPFAYLAVHSALEWKVDRLGEAARLNGGSPWTVWRTIQMPLLLPAYCSGAMLVFMDTVGDFGLPASIAAVFRFPTLPYSIYSALYTSPIRFDMAGVLSFYLVLLISIAMSIQFYVLRKSRFDFLNARATRAEPRSLAARGKWGLTAVNVVLVALAAGIPFGSNLLTSVTQSNSSSGASFTFDHYRKLFENGGQLAGGLAHSLEIAGGAALVGLVVGFFVSYVLTYSRFALRQTVDVISLISLAVPGVVLGIGYIFIWNQAWLEKIGLLLYGKPAILILASVAGAIPVITRVLTGAMAKVPAGLLSAAQMQGAGFGRRLATIMVPLLRGALVSAAMAAFGASVFDLATTSILFPPNFMTLPVVINKAFEDLKFGYAAAATLTGGGVVIGLIMFIEWALRPKKSKRARRGGI
ncbi:ABC transporter permease [Cohnella thailandensis]|uniref:Iron ABC transporter permease n=1 Tax=Cohnella thailandensis TaxID=557557 RepID=A0A841T577_9BACL|nr:iron ABC transporter permease [Cohnella thailandensis]MBB6638006.1 iron ABC transporter permease [Cohnella thailandensis]MBP1976854.1 iron(III) transport system permease protein [Cohnella thailandensis]